MERSAKYACSRVEGREQECQREGRGRSGRSARANDVAVDRAGLLSFLMMWLEKWIRVTRPSIRKPRRCKHETVHQLQARRGAETGGSRSRAARRQAGEIAAELFAGPGAIARGVFQTLAD